MGENLGMKKIILSLFILFNISLSSFANSENDKSFLVPYLAQLEKEISPSDLQKLKTSKREKLNDYHFSLGAYIRNKWLHGNRDPKLNEYLLKNGYTNKDDASMAIVEALWEKLNSKK